MKIYIVTDLEGVAGVTDFDNWCIPSGRYYETAKRLLTLETNAAVEGFFSGGATEILVTDGHGCGGLDVTLLDDRVEYSKGCPWCWPGHLDRSFDAIAWVGQHAKAGTQYAHMAHTGTFDFIDFLVNGISVGEFGQFVMCASEIGVPAIFGSGDRAFCKEAAELVPGIETVEVKRGVTPGSGDELSVSEYAARNLVAIHSSPKKSRDLIREGAARAVSRLSAGGFGLIDVGAPFERIVRLRKSNEFPGRVSREQHPVSVIDLLNLPYELVPDADAVSEGNDGSAKTPQT